MGFFGKLIKATVQTVLVPVNVVKDVVTMGGVLTDKEEPYTCASSSASSRARRRELESDFHSGIFLKSISLALESRRKKRLRLCISGLVFGYGDI